MTRRNFFHLGLAAAGMAAMWPRRAAWPALTRGTKPLRFVFCTDVHASPQARISSALEQAAASIRSRDADFVVVGGDLISGGYTASARDAGQSWDAYMAFHDQLGGEVWPVLGNHDLVGVDPADGSRPEADPRQVFRDRLGLDRTWYSFDTAGYHFMVLDSVRITTDEYRYHGRISREQREWIRRDLGGLGRDVPIILATHLPLRTGFFQTYPTEFSTPPPNQIVTNADDVLDLFTEHHLALVLQGHLHVNEILRYGRTTYVTGGAISGNWWQGDRYGTGPGYGLVTLSEQEVRWEYCEYAWEV